MKLKFNQVRISEYGWFMSKLTHRLKIGYIEYWLTDWQDKLGKYAK